MDLEMETEQVGEEHGYEYGEGYDHGSGEGSGPWEADNGLLGAADAAGGSFDPQGNDPYAPKAALSGLVLHPESAHGTHVIKVGVEVHNAGDWPIAEGELSLWIDAEPHNVETGKDEDNAERRATISVPVPALAPKAMFPFQLPLQVDPGHWHLAVTVQECTVGAMLNTVEGDVVVQGHHRHNVDYNEQTRRDLSVTVTHLRRVDESLYQVHFVVSNHSKEPVPAGLPVMGFLTSKESGMKTTQEYNVPGPIAAGASVDAYLTMEGTATGAFEAMILIDPNGPSNQQDTLVVQAEDIQGAPHGHGAAAHAAAPAHGG